MAKLACVILVWALAASVFAQVNETDPCALIDKAALAKVFGEIKEEPSTKEGLMKERQCQWTNMSGSWLTVSVYTAERWGLKKGSGNNPADLAGVGEEAFTDKRGTDKELYVRKGKLMLEVRTSSSSDIALAVATMALAKMP